MRLNDYFKFFRYGLVLSGLLMLCQAADAVPARPGVRRDLTLADGTVVNALLVGDEYGHYWLGEDGKGYRSNGSIYEEIDVQSVQRSARRQRAEANSRREQRLSGNRAAKRASDGYIGKKKGLIILVNFSDVAFQKGHDKSLYQRIANEKGFSDGKFKGSVYDYFYDQSDG